MRIAILTADTYSFLFGAWSQLLAQTRGHHELAGIWLVPDCLKHLRGLAVPLWYLQVFGVGTAVRLATHAASAQRRRVGTYATLAREHDAPLLGSPSPNAPVVAQWLRDQRVDVLLIAVGYVLGREIVEAPRVAVLNKHASLLPAYRGLLPVFWTLLDGGLPVGSTVHRVDELVDHGEILVQHAYPAERRTVVQWYERIFADMPGLLVEALEVLDGAPRRLVEGRRQSVYRSLPTRHDARAFFAKGHRFA